MTLTKFEAAIILDAFILGGDISKGEWELCERIFKAFPDLREEYEEDMKAEVRGIERD